MKITSKSQQIFFIYKNVILLFCLQQHIANLYVTAKLRSFNISFLAKQQLFETLMGLFQQHVDKHKICQKIKNFLVFCSFQKKTILFLVKPDAPSKMLLRKI